MAKLSDGQIYLGTESEKKKYNDLRKLLDKVLKTGGDYWNWPIASLLSLPSLQRILNLNYIYDMQLKSSGCILEFGVHYGSSFAQLINLRSIKEPYNYARHIYGFDTFSGFKGVTKSDSTASEGDFKIKDGYEKYIEKICSIHESFAPKNHLKKFTLIKGDASSSLKKLLSERPDLVVSLAIFDMDIYKPTKQVLKLIKPRLHKGSILVFDEFNCSHFSGETKAVREELDFGNIEFLKSPFLPFNTICKL